MPVIGIIGGIGPLATADFLAKIVRATPATRDQDHLPIVVHHNPQIPDRTAHLVAGGPDPTEALLYAARELEKNGATMIAVPCNTAHAFFDRMRPALQIPIVDMLDATAQFVRTRHPDVRRIGLLATDGTLQSGVYETAFTRAGLDLARPSPTHQAQVMDAIYGPRGIKAGHIDAGARNQLLTAIDDLCTRQNAELIVLGCTELPLCFEKTSSLQIGERTVQLIDPTEILARACVSAALDARLALAWRTVGGAALRGALGNN